MDTTLLSQSLSLLPLVAPVAFFWYRRRERLRHEPHHGGLDTLFAASHPTPFTLASAFVDLVSSHLGLPQERVCVLLFDGLSNKGNRGLVVRGGSPPPGPVNVEVLPNLDLSRGGPNLRDGKGFPVNRLYIPIGDRDAPTAMVVVLHGREGPQALTGEAVVRRVERLVRAGGERLAGGLLPRGWVRAHTTPHTTKKVLQQPPITSWSWDVFHGQLQGTYSGQVEEEERQYDLFVAATRHDGGGGGGGAGFVSSHPSALAPTPQANEALLALAVDMLGSERTGSLVSHFNLSPTSLTQFLTSVFSHYHPNYFHNLYHAFSVFHAAWLMAGTPTAMALITPLDRLALLLAALGHDLDHPGHNNGFEKAMSTELSLIHNDSSILERHHASVLAALLLDSQLLAPLKHPQVAHLRRVVFSSLLCTDMMAHMDLVKELEAWVPVVAGATPAGHLDGARSLTLIKGMLHTADLSGQAYPLEVSQNWSHRVVAEFRSQGFMEKALSLPISPWMQGLDTAEAVARAQHDFISKMATPLWRALLKILPELAEPVANLEASAKANAL